MSSQNIFGGSTPFFEVVGTFRMLTDKKRIGIAHYWLKTNKPF